MTPELKSKIMRVIKESYSIGEQNYSSKIDELIEELVMVKNNLKKGSNRKFFRKEASRIQNAIQSLRYLKRRSEKEMMKKDKVLISESELLDIVDKLGSVQIKEATRTSKGGFKAALGHMANIKDIAVQFGKDMTSSSNDAGTSADVMYIIHNAMEQDADKLQKTMQNQPYPKSSVAPSVQFIFNNTNMSAFTTCVFAGFNELLRQIVSTYDNGYYASTPPHPTKDPATGYLGVGMYIEDKYKKNLNTQLENVLKSGGVVSPLNTMVKAFNEMFVGIGDIPEESTYQDSAGAAHQITQDIINLFQTKSHRLEIDAKALKRAIMENIKEKQEVPLGLTLDPNKKVPLKTGAVKELAATIVMKLRDYIIDELVRSKSQLTNLLNKVDAVVKSSTGGVHEFVSIDLIVSDIDVFISDLRSIKVK